MSEYQVIARKYRPQRFKDVVGQDPTVTTLKNALKFGRHSHAYLFSGSKGTGKTTLARLFAKALNCNDPAIDFEPCNQCPSCKEISSGSSLDVLEIDGASHRGIEDIRQINETIAYAPSSGKYKIYLIDEVHMLTKEAFNALLKTLEEPPAKVKFFFATTEPHKIPPTILSRCQRFNLHRIPLLKIIGKLQEIISDFHISADQEALQLIASLAEGGLRDAEVLLDQVIAFREGHLTQETVSEVLGIMPKKMLFSLDHAIVNGDLKVSFEIGEYLFSTGKNLSHFIDELIEHYRLHLLIKIQGPSSPMNFEANEKEQYLKTTSLFTQEQCLYILDLLLQAQQHLKTAPFKRTAVEILLLNIIRSRRRIHIDSLIDRLSELEGQTRLHSSQRESLSEDPTPKLCEIPNILHIKAPLKVAREESTLPSPQVTEIRNSKTEKKQLSPKEEITHLQRKSRHDTLMRFAAKELEGSLQLKKNT